MSTPGKPSDGPLNEAEIDAAMDRYAQGDDRAFSLVHAGLYQRMRLFLLRLCRAPATADDLLQETFLRVHRARGSFAAGTEGDAEQTSIAKQMARTAEEPSQRSLRLSARPSSSSATRA